MLKSTALLSVAFAAVFLCSADAQSPDRIAAYGQHKEMVESSAFKKFRWQFIGPDNVSGRVTDVALPEPRGKNYSIYVATATGGVWKTNNEGTTWDAIFENQASTSIGDVTIDPSNHDVVWVGTGEPNIFRSSMAGTGVYRSPDAGKTWKHMGLSATHTIARIVIHPTNSDVIYVAASGHEWTDNSERGVYRSTDGGEHWSLIHHVNKSTGAIDLVMDPSDPSTLYASTWQRIRRLWNDPRNDKDTDSSGIFKTTDGGDSWKPINKGLPEPQWRGRIGIDLCRSQPKTIYAFVDCYQKAEGPAPKGEDSYGRAREKPIKGAEIYRSDDGGENWRKTSPNNRFMRGASSTYGWVFGQVRADPVDPDTVYMMGLSLNVSHDSGKSFSRLRGMHGDHHALWIDPENTNYLVNGNDGGVAISYDGGKNWRTSREVLPAVQFYNVAMDMDEPFHVYGSIQDHGSRRGTVTISGKDGKRRFRGVDWQGTAGGEASTHAVSPRGEQTLYSEGFYGSISRTDIATGERARIKPKTPEDGPELRGQWLAPFMISHHNPRIIYHGMNHVFRSMDKGDKWERISPDLSHGDDEKLGDIPYQTIFTMDESHHEFGVLYAGTDDGRLHRTGNGGGTWEDISSGLAWNRWISRVVTSRFEDGTVYATQNGKRNDDFTAYVWRSTDHGKSWKDIAQGIPCGPVNVIREDPTDGEILYVGTDLGVYITTDGARTWQSLSSGLPSTFVHDIAIHPRDDVMVIATHGRGMYALDLRGVRGDDNKRATETSAEVKARERKARHELANGLAKRWKGVPVGGKVKANWINDREFWYRKQLESGEVAFLKVDATTGKATEAPEFRRVFRKRAKDAAAKSKEAKQSKGRRGAKLAGRNSWKSPDGKWTVSIHDFNLWVSKGNDSKPVRLTEDGTAARPWACLSWAPDSMSALVCRVDPGTPGKLINVITSEKHGAPASTRSKNYPRPGDKMTSRELHLIQPDGWKVIRVEAEAIDFGRVRARWAKDGESFTYNKRDRGHQRSRVIEVNARDGTARTIIDERAKTFIDHYHKAWSRYLDETKEILWASERDGWNHLYLYDATTGKVKNQVTSGDWLVRGVDHVDVQKRQIWFRASGIDKDQDPYFIHYLRVDFDGTHLVRLTDGNGTHAVSYSPGRRYLLDTYSRVDAAPITELRSGIDGSLVETVEKGSLDALKEKGWRAPEPFVATGRDGKTKIHGVIYRPTNLRRRGRSYPIIESIYAGPHGSHVPKSFRVNRGVHAMAEMGFVVVQIDGMGTNDRSKAFHDVCWQNIGDAGLPDRRLWIEAAARRYRYMDRSRVGIYGTSAGGQSALGALLFHGDFYSVAVASCGCHDNRIDKASWNEQWMGYPVGPHYAEQSNVTHAGKLEGKLMLIVGELDTNVPPESTYQVVDALIRADKDFEFIALPRAGHTGGGKYGERRRRDFFMEHLLND